MKLEGKPASPQASRFRAAAALLPKFMAHRERDVVSIRLALEQADFETVSRLGHNMRGNGVSYGFPEISAIGERLEAAAHAKDERRALDELASLQAWLTGRQSTEER